MESHPRFVLRRVSCRMVVTARHAIEDIKAEVEAMCGGPPAPPDFGEKIVAAIKWVDGTVIDCVREVTPRPATT